MLVVAPRVLTNWWTSYKKQGQSSIDFKTRGRRQGEKRRLSKEQEKALQNMLKEKHPDQLKLPYALWTRKAGKRTHRDKIQY